MKQFTLPSDTIVINTIEHTAVNMLEDIVMTRYAWRVGDGPRHAEIVFKALDKCLQPAPDVGTRVRSSSRMRLPDKTYDFLLEQIALDPNARIDPRSANRFYLRIVQTIQAAIEVDESDADPKVDAVQPTRGN
jgi:hypothetical protein